MKAGPLWQVSVAADSMHETFLADCLQRVLNQPSSSYTDLRKAKVVVSVYCPSRPAKEKIRALSRTFASHRSGKMPLQFRLRVERLKPRDWAHAWKRHFRPLAIGGILLVKPSWSRKVPVVGQVVVVLDPGLSFGTGQHPTTRFCLEQLARFRPRTCARSFLDLGTGSGILAIAAARLGYAPVVGIDSDPAAVRIAKGNARENHARVEIRRSDLAQFLPGSAAVFDLVCANLTSDLLVDYAPEIAGKVASGGRLVLAGILHREFDWVRSVYAELGLRLLQVKSLGEWQSGAFAGFGPKGPASSNRARTRGKR